jgi:hypothetical protein
VRAGHETACSNRGMHPFKVWLVLTARHGFRSAVVAFFLVAFVTFTTANRSDWLGVANGAALGCSSASSLRSATYSPTPWRSEPVPSPRPSSAHTPRPRSAPRAPEHSNTTSVSTRTVWAWRKAFGVGGRATTKGSKRAVRTATKKGATAKRLRLRPPNRWTPQRGGWTAEQLALLGTDHDKAIAKKLNRTRGAVTTQRVKRKIPAFSGSPGGGRAWTDEELALLGTDHDEVVAARIGRTPGAVSQKRAARKVPTFRDRRRR